MLKWMLVVVSVWPAGAPTITWTVHESSAECNKVRLEEGAKGLDPVEGQTGHAIVFCVKAERWLVRR